MKTRRKRILDVGFIVVCIVAAIFFVVAARQRNDPPADTAAKTEQTAQQPKPSNIQSKKKSSTLSPKQMLAAPAEKVMFSTLPDDLQEVIKAEFETQVPSCIQDGKLVSNLGQPIDPDVAYSEKTAAAIMIMGCDGGPPGLFIKNEVEDWTYVTRTQSYFDCDVLLRYPIPMELLTKGTQTGECSSKAAGSVITYEEAADNKYQ